MSIFEAAKTGNCVDILKHANEVDAIDEVRCCVCALQEAPHFQTYSHSSLGGKHNCGGGSNEGTV